MLYNQDISEGLSPLFSWNSLVSVEEQLRHLVDLLQIQEKSDPSTREMASVIGAYTRSLCSSFMTMHFTIKSAMEQIPEIPSSFPAAVPSSSARDQNRPAYIEPAHRWLISHLHNPYPSAEYRTRLAKETQTRRKDIDHWFKVARQKIGWTMIREAYFKTRKQMIESATRYFLTSGCGQPLETRIVKEFALMRLKAQEMYDFSPSDLAVHIDKSIESSLKEAEVAEKPTQGAYKQAIHSPVAANTSTVYECASSSSPSPPSTGSSSAPSPETTHEDTVSPGSVFLSDTVQATGKRRTRDEDCHTTSKPCKRIRHIKPLPRSMDGDGPFSLPSSSSWPCDYSASLSLSLAPESHLLPSNPRKRRLSTSDSQPAFKRRMTEPRLGPLLRTVSDPTVPAKPTDVDGSSTLVTRAPTTRRSSLPASPTIVSRCLIVPLSLRTSFPVQEPSENNNDDWSLLTTSISEQADWNTDFSPLLADVDIDPLGPLDLSHFAHPAFDRISEGDNSPSPESRISDPIANDQSSQQFPVSSSCWDDHLKFPHVSIPPQVVV